MESPASFKKGGAENPVSGHKVQADGDGHWQTLGWPCKPHQGYKYPPCSLHSCRHSIHSRSSPQGWRSSLHKLAACRPPSAGSSDQHHSPHGPFSGPPLISQEGSRAIFIFYKWKGFRREDFFPVNFSNTLFLFHKPAYKAAGLHMGLLYIFIGATCLPLSLPCPPPHCVIPFPLFSASTPP